jgi:hypothetical protein
VKHKYWIFTADETFFVKIKAEDIEQAMDKAARKRGPYLDHSHMCDVLGLDCTDFVVKIFG